MGRLASWQGLPFANYGREAKCIIAASISSCFMPKKAKYDWGRSTNKRYQKLETRISTKLSATASSEPYADSGYIDIAQCLSIINRKLVRQGQVFKVKGMTLYSKDESPATTFKVGVLPRTWPMFNAYRKARSLWLEQAQMAFSTVGSGNMPKYLDFKVLADVKHVLNKQAGTDLLLPMDFDENMVTMTDVDWDYSKFHDANSTSDEFTMHMVGPHLLEDGTSSSAAINEAGTLDSAGLILSYQQSRGVVNLNQDSTGSVQQTNAALQRGPFGRIITYGDDQIHDIIDSHTSENDNPPYDSDEYAYGGSELRELVTVSTGRIPQKAQGVVHRLPAFEAPCGLVRVEVDAGSALSAEEVEIHFDTEIIGPM